MTMLIGGDIVRRGAGRLNPTSKVAALGILAVPLFLSVDAVTSGILVVAEVIALPLLGIGPRVLARTAWPLAFGLGTLWFANWLVAGTVAGMLPVSLRLVALGLPGLVLVVTTDPVDLADALVQRWHAPARFAYGALAGFRLLPLLIAELFTMARARRARGMGGGANPVRWVRLGVGLLFGLLVQAIRRAVRLAAAMDSRGFAAAEHRTFARVSTVTGWDRLFVLAAAVLVIGAVATSIGTGHWRLLFS
ncbi:MAG: energy-coupling factor transporter transmembrane component T family protein [Jatrophihabitans sp.]